MFCAIETLEEGGGFAGDNPGGVSTPSGCCNWQGYGLRRGEVDVEEGGGFTTGNPGGVSSLDSFRHGTLDFANCRGLLFRNAGDHDSEAYSSASGR
jgi:hypothetical protein